MALNTLLGIARRTAGTGATLAGEALSGAGRKLLSDDDGGTARSGARKPGMDDRTLASKVETEIFRGRNAPKGSVNVSVVDGVVELRGQVKRPADVKALEAKVRAVPEVRGVENLLHLPKTPARSATTRRATAAKAKPRTGRSRTTAQDEETRHAKPQEPKPDELAGKRAGRQPAPMGSGGGGNGGSAGS